MARIIVGSVCAALWSVAWGQPPALEPFAQEIPSAGYKMEMVPIPGDPAKGIGPFWMSKTEVTWEAFDTFIYRLDEEDGKLPALTDAVTRPSKPYLPPDRGFGHEGYAAICVGAKNAAAFCVWLSERSGRTYRLATEAEWEHAARAGGGAAYPWGDGAEALGDYAWFAGNAKETPHPVGTKKANAWGLHDMLGNVREWVVGADGVPVTKGGSFEDAAEALRVSERVPLKREWNASDPQIPKSQWWLSDGKTVGFRVVCVPGKASGSGKGETKLTPVVEPAKKE
ncbi:MAG: SUMF1/EgtB/PvdO family nonheme iron enzyme [Phycisphaerae bacterium]|nr:SUMF1/EgtB/PvdO family nonheme iron enzyme [Phycisphaerae bacterium]